MIILIKPSVESLTEYVFWLGIWVRFTDRFCCFIWLKTFDNLLVKNQTPVVNWNRYFWELATDTIWLSLKIWFRSKNLWDGGPTKETSIYESKFEKKSNETIHFQNSDKETALHSAAQFGHLASVRVLLEHGADPNIKNCREETALDLAALYGR